MNDFLSYFDGLMLGDGSISKANVDRTYKYSQRCKYIEWLSDLKYLFNSNGIRSNICKTKPGGFSKSGGYNFTSVTKDFFSEQHERWYIKDYNVDEYPIIRWHLDVKTEGWFAWRKIVPKDIILTPECVLSWYLGDGSLFRKNYNTYNIRIATIGFTKSEIEYLVFLLNDYVVNFARYVAYNKCIDISRLSDVKAFFSYLNYLYHPDCYNYKFFVVT